MKRKAQVRPVTMRDVAATAGVNASTVSRALRDDPRLATETRLGLKRLARELGYRPNPYVAAFTAQVRGYRRSPNGAAIAIVDTYGDDAAGSSCLSRYSAGAMARATEHGYHTEALRLGELGGEMDRVREVIDSRGIRALLVLPIRGQNAFSGFDFGPFAAATIDLSLRHPPLHRASPDYFQNMELALDALYARRRHRIAFCTYGGEVRRIGSRWLGAFLAWQEGCAPDERIPPHVSLHDETQTASREEAEQQWTACREVFWQWLDQHRPDAVVSNDHFFLDWLRESGRRVPGDVTFASLGVPPGKTTCAGVDQMHEQVGAAAIELILAQIHRNDFGLPRSPRTVLVPGVWVDGETVT